MFKNGRKKEDKRKTKLEKRKKEGIEKQSRKREKQRQ